MKSKKIMGIVFGLAVAVGGVFMMNIFFQTKKIDETGLTITREEVSVQGLKKEYRLFFVSDTHIALCDDRDATLVEKAAQRAAARKNSSNMEASDVFDKMVGVSNALKSDVFLMGGDILDSAMYASIEFLEEDLSQLNAPYLYELGNHDFEYGEEYFSEKAYQEYLPRLANLTDVVNSYQVMEYEDLILFAVNDQNNQIGDDALEAVKTLLEKGKPIVVLMHVPIEPLVENSLWDETIKVWGANDAGNSKVLLGSHSVVPNATTKSFLDLILAKDSQVKLVLGGHVHFMHKDLLNDSTVQLISGAGYGGNALFITLKPEK